MKETGERHGAVTRIAVQLGLGSKTREADPERAEPSTTPGTPLGRCLSKEPGWSIVLITGTAVAERAWLQGLPATELLWH